MMKHIALLFISFSLSIQPNNNPPHQAAEQPIPEDRLIQELDKHMLSLMGKPRTVQHSTKDSLCKKNYLMNK